MSVNNDVPSLPNFECKDRTGISARWRRWIRAFDLYVMSKGTKNADQKKALLLHTAEMDVQDVYYTLSESNDEEGDVYEKAKATLAKCFNPPGNVPFERCVFRKLAQEPNETVEQFITRLRQNVDGCEFSNVDDEIRDQVITKCSSNNLRRKLLEKGTNLNIERTVEIARAMEESVRQASSIEGLSKDVNRITLKDRRSSKFQSNYSSDRKNYNRSERCFNCGYEGHKHYDKDCPAIGERCRKCKNFGHYEIMCKTKEKPQASDTRNNKRRGEFYKPDKRNSQNKSNYKSSYRSQVRQLEEEKEKERRREFDSDENEPVYRFSKVLDDRVNIEVGGSVVSFIVDSGSSPNVIDRHQWKILKRNRIKVTSLKEHSTKKLYPYACKEPLHVALEFTTNIKFGSKILDEVEFVVIEGEGQALLGRETALKLGVLEINTETVNMVDNSVDTILDKYKSCFEGLGKLKDFKLRVPIDRDVTPIVQPIRRVSYQLRDKLTDKLKELEDLDIIEKVNGPSTWVSPVVCVLKKTARNKKSSEITISDIRLCVDMRLANTAVRRERHPIPTIDEILQDMSHSKIFSKLDILWAYHQLELAEESRDITTFITHNGLYRYKRLMFGISCAPEMYQKVIQQSLQHCEGVHNIFDDIIVHAPTVEEHNKRLENVIRVIHEKGITLNRDKCQFNMTNLEFMGHVLSDRGIGPTAVKVEAIVNARAPQTASEVRSFLGLVNFTGRYIADLSTISEPLRKLTKKSEQFVWEWPQQKAFNELKRRLASARTLAYFDKDAITKVIADASPVGLGAVLIQIQHGEHRIISYASRSLTDVERRYSQTEKEALALVWACERFHVYLLGTDFELLTDHKALECIYSTRSKPCARIERWVLRMQPYRYTVKYIKGTQNIADSLSRLLSDSNIKYKSTDHAYIKFVARQSTPKAMSTKEIETESINDPECEAIRNHLLKGKWENIEFKEYLPVRHELCAIGKLVLRGTRIIIPVELREKVLTLAHEGHPGIVGMKQRLRACVWWPGIDKQAETFCKSCHGCQLVSKATPPEPMKRTQLPSAPWQHLAADLLGPLPTGDYIFVLVDYYSRYFEAEITKSTTSDKIIFMLSKIFVTHGLPLSIQTDNGPQFISKLFADFMTENGIEHRRTTPLWPQANGEVERQNASIMKRIRIAQAEKSDWKADLDKYLIMYRSTPHTTTGRKIRTKLPQLNEFCVNDTEVRDRDSERKEKGKVYADNKRCAKESDICVGDKVLVRQDYQNKFSTNFSPITFDVIRKDGNSLVVQSESAPYNQYRRNITRVKKYNTNVHRESQLDTNVHRESQLETPVLPSENDNIFIDPPCDNSKDNRDLDRDKLPDTTVTETRVKRKTKMPERYKDYDCF